MNRVQITWYWRWTQKKLFNFIVWSTFWNVRFRSNFCFFALVVYSVFYLGIQIVLILSTKYLAKWSQSDCTEVNSYQTSVEPYNTLPQYMKRSVDSSPRSQKKTQSTHVDDFHFFSCNASKAKQHYQFTWEERSHCCLNNLQCSMLPYTKRQYLLTLGLNRYLILDLQSSIIIIACS